MKLKSLRLVNFMNYHDKIFSFIGDKIKVSGRNGEGKSSIATAYSWLLFNTDMELNNNPVVRRKVHGVFVDDVDTFVEAVFDIDGKEVTIKKVQKRKIKETEKIVDGRIVKVTNISDDNSYFINDVPKTLKAFNEYFGIDIKIMQMCSNINAFLSKKDMDMREYLFSKIENVIVEDIANKCTELSELAEWLEIHSRNEIEAMSRTRLAEIKKQLPILEGQIKEKERDITENSAIDFAELELHKNELKRQLEEIWAKEMDASKQIEDYQKSSDLVMELKFKQSDLVKKANEDLVKQKKEIHREIDKKNKDMFEIADIIQLNKRDIFRYQDGIKFLEEKRERLKDLWKKTNSEIFNEGTAICPSCHRELPQDERERLLRDFDKSKAERIADIEENGIEVKNEIENTKKMIANFENCNKDYENNIDKLKKELAELEKELSELPTEIDISDTDEYKAVVSQIAECEHKMSEFDNISALRKKLKSEEIEISQNLLEVEKQLAKADTSADEERLEELRQERLDKEQVKADYEKILRQIDELDKKKSEALSDKINGMFLLVKFKLFEFNKSGGHKNCCVPMIDGKSILTLESNKGNRLLGRIDIINSIQKMEGINVPVFVDDAESFDYVNICKALDLLECQTILLKVNENDLKIEEV